MKVLGDPEGVGAGRYDPRSITRLPGFWRGALRTRQELAIDPGRVGAAHRLLAMAEAGRDVTQTEEYRTWLGYEAR